MTDAAFTGFSVAGFAPRTAPNPSCCSDPRCLCRNCALEALERWLPMNRSPMRPVRCEGFRR